MAKPKKNATAKAAKAAKASPVDVLPPSQEHATAERVQQSIRMRFNPIRGLTPEKLASDLEAFRLGYFRQIALTWDAIERRDETLQSVIPKRKKSVARHGFQILTRDDSPEALAQKAVLEYFYGHLTATNMMEPDEQGGLSLLLRQMMDAVGKRYAVHEIIWEPSPDGLTATFRHFPLWWFEGITGKLRFLESEFGVYGQDMQPGEWLVTVGDGIMESTAICYLFKRMPTQYWLAFAEKFGMPPLLGKTNAAKGSEEWNAMKDALANFGFDWAAIINLSNNIEAMDIKSQGGNLPYHPLIEWMDRKMMIVWRGNDLGTSSKHNGTGASLQADESEILELDDTRMLQETLTAQASRPVLKYYFGDAPELAYLKLGPGEKENTDQDIKIDTFLASVNAPLTVRGTMERYGRPLPEDGEAILSKPVPVAPPPITTIANDDGDNEALVQNAIGDVYTLKSKWLATLKTLMKGVEGALNNERMSDEEVLTFIQHMADSIPSLLPKLDLAAFADPLEAAMGSSALAGLESALKAMPLPVTAANDDLTVDLTTPQPLADAVAQLGAKTPVGAILRSADWAKLPLALRQRGQFSSGVESVRVMQRMQDGLTDAITLARNAARADGSTPGTFKMNRTKFIADMRELTMQEGLTPADEEKIGTLEDITSEQRLGLIYDTQIKMAQGYANWKYSQQQDVVDAWPAQELVRGRHSRVPRDWVDRFIKAAKVVGDEDALKMPNGRLVARKDSGIWTALSRFDTPYPPFDYNSGMRLKQIDRETAIALGVIKKDEPAPQSQVEDFNAQLQASVTDLHPKMRSALKSLFGDQIEIGDDTANWRGQ